MTTKAKYHQHKQFISQLIVVFFGKVSIMKVTYSARVKTICSSRFGSHVHIEE
jgi:hypothetical protein